MVRMKFHNILASITLIVLLSDSVTGHHKKKHHADDSRSRHNTKIVGGEKVEVGSFPYLGMLLYKNELACGVTILCSNMVLTAAQCVFSFNYKDLSVKVGSNNISEGGLIYKVSSYKFHDAFNPKSRDLDVAVIEIAGRFEWTDLVKPVTLANTSLAELPSNTKVIVAGWGQESLDEPISNSLQCVPVNTMNQQTCREIIARANNESAITDRQICTYGTVNRGVCLGDTGGPLLTTDKVQIGIISWLFPCARGLPDVHTKVAAVYDWIKTTCNCL